MDRNKIALRALAVLIALRALTDVLKPLGAGSGLVFFGAFLTGTPETILAPLVGAYMLVYAYGMWAMRRFALPMGVAYAAYVLINLTLFPALHGLPRGMSTLAYLAFAVLGLGVTWAAVWLLVQRRPRLI
jgi:hypothetical protein